MFRGAVFSGHGVDEIFDFSSTEFSFLQTKFVFDKMRHRKRKACNYVTLRYVSARLLLRVVHLSVWRLSFYVTHRLHSGSVTKLDRKLYSTLSTMIRKFWRQKSKLLSLE